MLKTKSGITPETATPMLGQSLMTGMRSSSIATNEIKVNNLLIPSNDRDRLGSANEMNHRGSIMQSSLNSKKSVK